MIIPTLSILSEILPGWADVKPWIFPLAAIAVSTFFGFLLEKYVTRLVKKIRPGKKMPLARALLYIIKGVIIAVFIFIGFLVATRNTELSVAQQEILKDIALALVITSFTIAVSRIIVSLSQSYGGSWFGDLTSSSLFAYIIRITIFIIGFLIVLDTFGISIAPALTALGVGGLAVALALQDTLSNLFAGIQLVITQQIQKGDYIELESGESGYVVDISWRVTKIRSILNYVIVIPNAKLSSSIMKNYHQPEEPMTIIVRVGVHYDSDLQLVKRALAEETLKVVQANKECCLATFEPRIRFGGFQDSSIEVKVLFRVMEFDDQYYMISEMVEAIHGRLRKEGVVIPFPIRTLHMPDGESISIRKLNKAGEGE